MIQFRTMPNRKGCRRSISVREREEILAKYLGGRGARDIASDYGCAGTTVWGIVTGLIANRNREDYETAKVRMMELATSDHHWIAGIVDGEGWVGIGKNGTFNGPRVTVASVDEVMAPTLLRLLGGGICLRPGRDDRRRDQRCWDLNTLSDVRAFCEVIGPSLRVKPKQAEILATYCESRMVNRSKKYTQTEQGMVAQLRILNRRGRRSDGEVLVADQEHLRS